MACVCVGNHGVYRCCVSECVFLHVVEAAVQGVGFAQGARERMSGSQVTACAGWNTLCRTELHTCLDN